MNSALKSDIGKHRDINEDYCLSAKIEDKYIYIVADGMGGHLAGEVASKLAVESIYSYLEKNKDQLDNSVRIINEAVSYANDIIFEKSKKPDYKDMGTTVELVLVVDDKAYVGHVGDSRVYLMRDNRLDQITRDHSLINDLIDSGSITEPEAISMPQKNIITRALGSEKTVDCDIHEVDLEEEDIIMLCSDGVTGGLSDQDLLEVLEENISLEEKVDKIITMSNLAGGYDNSTVILAEMREAHDR